jgi:3-dehydroquinate dehydratase-2
LNLLGTREPHIYGATTLAQIDEQLRARARELGCTVATFQSNHEGVLIDHLQQHGGGADGIVINPGALSHYSIALYDALRATGKPVVEVHLTNLHAREEWRQRSVTAAAARAVIAGMGPVGYRVALEFLATQTNTGQ